MAVVVMLPGQGPFEYLPRHSPPRHPDVPGQIRRFPDPGVWLQCGDGLWRAFYASGVGPGRSWGIEHPDDPNWWRFTDAPPALRGTWVCRHAAYWYEPGYEREFYRMHKRVGCGIGSHGDGSCGPHPTYGVSDEDFEEYRARLMEGLSA